MKIKLLNKKNKNLKNLKIIFFGFLLFLLFFIFPTSTKAWDPFNVGKSLRFGLLAFVLYLLTLAAYVPGLLADLTFMLLEWVTSENFISWSYTNPSRNEVIRLGLGITQSFVNIILVLSLIYIALATILQLESFQTKKALKNFVIVALLVNFAPLICGLIVDPANIIVHYFLGLSGHSNISFHIAPQELLDSVKDIVSKAWEQEKWEDTFSMIWSAMKGVAMMIPIYLIAVVIYLLFAIMFLLRRIAIWILVILSPVAFAFYILPKTRKYWEFWWKQFIEWTFIGVTGAFFIYLGGVFVHHAIQSPNNPTTSSLYNRDVFEREIDVDAKITKVPSSQKTIISRGALAFVAGIFGLIGVYFTAQTGAMGASIAISLAKGITGGLGKKVMGATKWLGRRTGRGIGRYAEEKLKTKEIAGGMAKKMERTPVLRHFLPQRLKEYGEFKPAIDKALAKTKDYSPKTKSHGLISGAVKGTDAAAYLLGLATTGNTQSLFDSAKKEIKELKGASDEQVLQNETFQKRMRGALYVAQKGGYLSDIIRRDPRLATLLAGQEWAGSQFKKASSQEAINLTVQEARGSHIANWEREVLENKQVVKSMLNHFDRDRWLRVQKRVKNGQETALKTIDELTEEAGGWDQLMSKVGKERKYELALQSPVFRANGWREGRIGEKGTPGERLIKTPGELKEEERKKQRKPPGVGEGEGEKGIFLP